jgi:hypothetical protein
MKRPPFGNYLTLYLLLACALFALILAFQSSRTQSIEIDALLEEPTAPPGEVLISPVEYTPPTFKVFDEILRRPLFSESREPPPPPEKVAVTPVPVVTHIRLELEGVAITPDARIAVLRDLTTKQVLHLAEGDNHNGWKLESVHTDKALFRFFQQTVELELLQDEGTPVKKTKNTREVQTAVPDAAGKQ